LEITVTISNATKKGSDFAGLCQEIRAARLLDRRRGDYSARIALTFAALAATWLVFALVGDSWYQMIVAAVLGLVFTQVAFLGHDGGHQQVARSKRTNDGLSILTGDVLVGLSFGWWVDKHNRHHSRPNYVGYDPDIADSVLAVTAEQAASRDSTIGRFVTSHQAWLFFPMLTLEGLNLHVQSAIWLWRGKGRRYRRTELVLLTVHTLVYVGALLLVLSPLQALAFFAVHQAVWGLYMGCSFAPNHKGMPTIPVGGKLDFLRRQVLTSRNVRGGRLTDFMLGGLNYQVEHHLFPNMPRANLRKAQPIVQAYCRELQISYTETSLYGSYAAALRHLHTLGEPLRAARRRVPVRVG
jgi:fatty acid desaturase